MIRIHPACGDVYLLGFKNIDIYGFSTSSATKEQLEANATTLDNYYKYAFIEDTIERQKNKRPFIIDEHWDILKRWPYQDNTIDELILVNAWEHFDREEIQHLIKEIQRTMKVGSKFIVSFPDIKETVLQYYDNDPEHCFTLIYCNGKDKYSRHKYAYTEETFVKQFSNWSFKRINIINHDYPSIQLEGIKLS